jgi:hypothetical protein
MQPASVGPKRSSIDWARRKRERKTEREIEREREREKERDR